MFRDHVLPATVVGVLLLCGIIVAATRPAPPEARAIESSAVAVVELFTSKGCPTCTPADSLLASIHHDAVQRDRSVFALDFPVDHHGRRAGDASGPGLFHERQRRYADALDNHMYAPQMIVNGRDAFVGSDGYHARRSIAAALRDDAAVLLTSRATSTGQSVEVQVSSSRIRKGSVLNVALVADETSVVGETLDGLSADRAMAPYRSAERASLERSRATGTDVDLVRETSSSPREASPRAMAPRTVSPSDGRSDKTHHKVNVVRAFASQPLVKDASVVLKAPAGIDLSNAAIIAYAQDAETMRVLGATRVSVQ